MWSCMKPRVQNKEAKRTSILVCMSNDISRARGHMPAESCIGSMSYFLSLAASDRLSIQTTTQIVKASICCTLLNHNFEGMHQQEVEGHTSSLWPYKRRRRFSSKLEQERRRLYSWTKATSSLDEGIASMQERHTRTSM